MNCAACSALDAARANNNMENNAVPKHFGQSGNRTRAIARPQFRTVAQIEMDNVNFTCMTLSLCLSCWSSAAYAAARLLFTFLMEVNEIIRILVRVAECYRKYGLISRLSRWKFRMPPYCCASLVNILHACNKDNSKCGKNQSTNSHCDYRCMFSAKCSYAMTHEQHWLRIWRRMWMAAGQHCVRPMLDQQTQ